MNHFTLSCLLFVTFSLGLITGDAWTPLSGRATHAMIVRMDDVERRVADLELKSARLSSEIEDLKSRLQRWLDAPQPRLTRNGDGGYAVGDL